MIMKKRLAGVILIIIFMVGFVIAYSWFGLFSSPEYYRGFDWNTGTQKLEWRLPKDYYWQEEVEYKSQEEKSKDYADTRFRETFTVDKKTKELKEVSVYYSTDDSTKMNRIYETEVEKIKKILGVGTEGEYYDALYTEWRGKHSIIRVIKNDYPYDDLNIAVKVVYQDKEEYDEPYFTEAHIGEDVFEMMIEKFYCVSAPEYNPSAIKGRRDTDYSNYKLNPTRETKKVIALMNKHLFDEDVENGRVARLIASASGITKDHPLTVDWFMKHPVKMREIMKELTRKEDFLERKSEVDKAYDLLTDSEKRNY